MLDTNSRYIVASRTIEDRLAEVRRGHVLREAQDAQERRPLTETVGRGPSLVDRVAAVLGVLSTTDRNARPAPSR